jgi:metal-responsive CopG/Arc/MetJ family transcriptional regulator
MAVGADKIRKQISLSKELLDFAETVADKEERTLSGLISVALKEYFKNHNIDFKEEA